MPIVRGLIAYPSKQIRKPLPPELGCSVGLKTHILRDTAELLLQLVLPATVDKPLLNLVIETAYQLYRRTHPAPAIA